MGHGEVVVKREGGNVSAVRFVVRPREQAHNGLFLRVRTEAQQPPLPGSNLVRFPAATKQTPDLIPYAVKSSTGGHDTVTSHAGGEYMEINYALVKELPEMDYDVAVERTTELLADEGFGVLTEIDVKATLKKKIDVDFRRYVILGACNPVLAHKALSGEPMIGVLLPCNVLVMERDGGGSIVAGFKPTAGFSLVDNPDVAPIAEEVEGKMRRALDRLG